MDKNEAIQKLKKKASKLPLGFIVGAAIGGGLFLYSTRNRGSKTVNAVTNVAKLVAPYVIIAILDKMVENYEVNRNTPIEDAEAEIA